MLGRLVNFDHINSGAMRPSFRAVNVRTGNRVYLDTEKDAIRPEHVLASGAVPPAFPAIEIEGELYWDGGLVSNSSLDCTLANGARRHTLAFQVDLWRARGDFRRNLAAVETRRKEIRYSSRTRDHTDHFKRSRILRHTVARLVEFLPELLKTGPEAKLLEAFGDRKVYNIIHLINPARRYEGYAKDYEFSRPSMQDRGRESCGNPTAHRHLALCRFSR